MYFCIHCGKPIEDQAKFCTYCGEPVLNLNEQEGPQHTVRAAAPTTENQATEPQCQNPTPGPQAPVQGNQGAGDPVRNPTLNAQAPAQGSQGTGYLRQNPAPNAQAPVQKTQRTKNQKPKKTKKKKNPWPVIVIVLLLVILLAVVALLLVEKGILQLPGSQKSEEASVSSEVVVSASASESKFGKESDAADGDSATAETVNTEQPATESKTDTTGADAANEGAAAETEETVNENETTVAQVEADQEESYYAYIKRELIPEYGYASEENTSKTITNSSFESECYWDDRTGIVSAAIADLDADGIDDLVVLRFAKDTTDSSGRLVLNLYADIYSRDADKQIYQITSSQILECASSDRMEYRCSLVPKDSGYYLMVQSIYWPDGQIRIFAIGKTNALQLYGLDGGTWSEQHRIMTDTAGDTPFHLYTGDQDQAFTTYADAMQAAGITLKTGDATEPYFEGEIDYTLLMEYTMSSTATTGASEATIDASLSDQTGLKEQLDQIPE